MKWLPNWLTRSQKRTVDEGGSAVVNRSSDPDRSQMGRGDWMPRRRANIVITHDNALQLAVCFACQRNISEDIAKLPWNVYLRSMERRIRLDNSRLNRLLNTRPNPEMGAFEFRRTLISWALTWGNGIAEIERDTAGRPLALWPISSDRVDVFRRADGLWYRITNYTGEATWLPAADVLHLRGPSYDGIWGHSMISLASQSIGFGLAAEEHGSSFFGNNQTVGTYLKVASRLSTDAHNRLKEEMEKRRGSRNAYQGLILEEGAELDSLGMSQVDAQYLETRRFEVEEVARFWRVPPHKVGELSKAHFNNIEQLNISYATDCLQPWIKNLEEEANYKLITAPGDKRYTRIALQGLMRGDSRARAEFYKAMWNIGVYSVNDIREKEDMDPVGPEGDERIVPMNMTTLKRLVSGENMKGTASTTNVDEGGDEGGSDDDRRAVVEPMIRAVASRFIANDIKRAEYARSKYHHDESGFSIWVEQHHAKSEQWRSNALMDLLEPVERATGSAFDVDNVLDDYRQLATACMLRFYAGEVPDVDVIGDELLRSVYDAAG